MSGCRSRKKRLAAIALGMLLLALVLLRDRLVDALLSREIRTKLASMDHHIDLGPGLHVVLCGTGTPQSNPHHAPPCLAIVAGDQYLVFDAGDGTAARLDSMGLPVSQVDAVFITHWHSDHFAGLGYLMNDAWVQNRRGSLPVYGPSGVDRVLAGFMEAYALDAGYRVANRAGALTAAETAGEAHAIPDHPDLAETVYSAGGLRVSAFAVDHRPVEPALGYRVEYAGRVVVISGDTRLIPIDAARGADVLVHEALSRALLGRVIAEARDMGLHERARHVEDIIDYHADTLALAQLAEAAGVETLVLTHLIPPPPPNALGDWLFTRGMSEYFHGRLVVGRDGMILTP